MSPQASATNHSVAGVPLIGKRASVGRFLLSHVGDVGGGRGGGLNSNVAHAVYNRLDHPLRKKFNKRELQKSLVYGLLWRACIIIIRTPYTAACAGQCKSGYASKISRSYVHSHVASVNRIQTYIHIAFTLARHEMILAHSVLIFHLVWNARGCSNCSLKKIIVV